ncbi:hypothetical protein ACVIKO_002727 [Rhizobium ruizarguesonis]
MTLYDFKLAHNPFRKSFRFSGLCAENIEQEKPAKRPACRSPELSRSSGDGVEIELAVSVAVEIVGLIA